MRSCVLMHSTSSLGVSLTRVSHCGDLGAALAAVGATSSAAMHSGIGHARISRDLKRSRIAPSPPSVNYPRPRHWIAAVKGARGAEGLHRRPALSTRALWCHARARLRWPGGLPSETLRAPTLAEAG